MQLIDGKLVAQEYTAKLKQRIETLRDNNNLIPGLAVVIIGDDPASHAYVRSKIRKAEELGVYSEKHALPANATQEEVLNLVQHLNDQANIHGILVQSPPPPQIDERAVVDAILPAKDVDCFHPVNVGRLTIGDEQGFVPCTPQGIMELLSYYNIETEGKHAVVAGRSNIVGKPMALLLARKNKYANCTVTICHSRTRDLGHITRQADILVAAIGRPHIITADMIKEGAVVIDVGSNRIEDASRKSGYRWVGDVDFEGAASRCDFITPVPGGVGPMTIAMLFRNAVWACCNLNGLEL